MAVLHAYTFSIEAEEVRNLDQLLIPSSSPSDQAILEAEYKLNPKPSKAARAEIVEKVTLNEKEVQVRYSVLGQSRWKTRPNQLRGP
jgi:hypothetical protein